MSSRSHSQTATRTSSQARARLANFQFKRPGSSTHSEVESNSEETESLRQIFQSEFKDLESEINQLKYQCHQDSKIASKSTKQASSDVFQLDNDWLETKNIEIQKDNLKIETENELLRKKIEEIRHQKTKAAEAETHEKMATLQERLESHKTIGTQIENLVKENGERTEAIVALQRKFDEMQTELEAIEHDKQQEVMQKRRMEEREMKQSNALRERISQNEEKITSLNRRILNIDAESEDIISQMEEESIKIEARAEQNIEDLTEKISALKMQLEDTEQKEKILNFWKKARKMSLCKESLDSAGNNLKSEIKKHESISKQQAKELKELAKFEIVPQQDYLDSLQKKVTDLKEKIDEQKLAISTQLQKLKSREVECQKQQKLDAATLCEELESLKSEVLVLEKESLKLQQQQNTQNYRQQRDLAELNGKCERIKQQAVREVGRYRDLLETERQQIGNRQINTHFMLRLESEASYNMDVLERELQFLLREKQQSNIYGNISGVNVGTRRNSIDF